MKKIALTMVAMFAFAITSFANNETGATETKIETKIETTTTNSIKSEDDGWYCEVNINGKISYCYWCDCAEFAKSLKGSSSSINSTTTKPSTGTTISK